jgi:hypothetical protein
MRNFNFNNATDDDDADKIRRSRIWHPMEFLLVRLWSWKCNPKDE